MTEQSFFDSGAYERIFYSGGAPDLATRFIHWMLEKNNKTKSSTVLEVGGGEGFHVGYVDPSYDKYILSDIAERPLYGKAKVLQKSGKLLFLKSDAHNLTVENNSVDRVIMMCVLHHLSDVEQALSEARRVTCAGGTISIYLLCDPGFIYVTLRKLFLRTRTKHLGIDYELINAREHRNHYPGIKRLIYHVFRDDNVQEKKFPFPMFDFNLNLFSCIYIHKAI